MRDQLQSEECSQRLKALAEPDRLRIIQCLQSGPKNVGEIAELLGVEIANVSHHLGVLRHAKLVNDRRDGRFIVYSLPPEVYQPPEKTDGHGILELGCCRLELGKP